MVTSASHPVSARNQITGTVVDIQRGAAMSVITLSADGQQFISAITNQAVEDLGLQTNDSVVALVKSTETMLVKGNMEGVKISARNKIGGRVSEIQKGNAMACVTVERGSLKVTSSITRQAVEDLQLKNGDPVTAIFKATEVLLQRA